MECFLFQIPFVWRFQSAVFIRVFSISNGILNMFYLVIQTVFTEIIGVSFTDCDSFNLIKCDNQMWMHKFQLHTIIRFDLFGSHTRERETRLSGLTWVKCDVSYVDFQCMRARVCLWEKEPVAMYLCTIYTLVCLCISVRVCLCVFEIELSER